MACHYWQQFIFDVYKRLNTFCSVFAFYFVILSWAAERVGMLHYRSAADFIFRLYLPQSTNSVLCFGNRKGIRPAKILLWQSLFLWAFGDRLSENRKSLPVAVARLPRFWKVRRMDQSERCRRRRHCVLTRSRTTTPRWTRRTASTSCRPVGTAASAPAGPPCSAADRWWRSGADCCHSDGHSWRTEIAMPSGASVVESTQPHIAHVGYKITPLQR